MPDTSEDVFDPTATFTYDDQSVPAAPVPPTPAVAPATPPDDAEFDSNQTFRPFYTPDTLLQTSAADLEADRTFNPSAWGAENKEVVDANPLLQQRLLDAYKLKNTEFHTVKSLAKKMQSQTPWQNVKMPFESVIGGGWDMAKAMFKGGVQFVKNAQASAGAVYTMLGDNSDDAKVDAAITALKSGLEVAASAETANAGLGNMVRKSLRDIGETVALLPGSVNKPLSQYTNEEWKKRFDDDVTGHLSSLETAKANGVYTSAILGSGDAWKQLGVEVDPNIATTMAPVTDPMNLALMGSGTAAGLVTKIGGKWAFREVAQAATKTAASNFVKAGGKIGELGESVVGGMGRAFEVTGDAVSGGISSAEKAVGLGRRGTMPLAGLSVLAGAEPTTAAIVGGVRALPRGVSMAGRGLQLVARYLPVTGRIAGDVVEEAFKGYGHGLMFMAPLAIGADDDELEGLMGIPALGAMSRGGARLGAHGVYGLKVGPGAAAQDYFGKKNFQTKDQTVTPPEVPSYGDTPLDHTSARIEESLDSAKGAGYVGRVDALTKQFDAETAAMDFKKRLTDEQLNQRAQKRAELVASVPEVIPVERNLFNWVKWQFRDAPVEFYLTDDAGMKVQTDGTNGRGWTSNMSPDVTHADGTVTPGKVRVFFNTDVESVSHEISHVFEHFDPEGHAALVKQVMDKFTPDQSAAFKHIYEYVWNDGKLDPATNPAIRRLTPEDTAKEAVAEVFSRLFKGHDLSNVDPIVRNSVSMWASSMLEKMGIPLFDISDRKRGAPGYSGLGVRPSTEMAKHGDAFIDAMRRKAAEDGGLFGEGSEPASPAPKPAAPAPAPAPAPVVPTPAPVVPTPAPPGIQGELGLDDIKPKSPTPTTGIKFTEGATPVEVTPDVALKNQRAALVELKNTPEWKKFEKTNAAADQDAAMNTPQGKAWLEAQKIREDLNKTQGPKNIRANKAQQDSFQNRRFEETGTESARALAGKLGDPDRAAKVAEISKSLDGENPPLEIDYQSVKDDGSPDQPTTRNPRRTAQEQAYIDEALGALPEETRKLAQKLVVPVRWEEVAGKPQLLVASIDKVIANAHNLASQADAVGFKLPYATKTGGFTPEAWQQFVKDAQDYNANQANGFKGNGEPLVRVKEEAVPGMSIPAENLSYTPVPLSEAKMNFINAAQGLKLPFTAREVKGAVPGNVKGQILAEVNARQPAKPTVIRPQDIQKQTYKTSGRDIMETNPLRNEMRKAGINTDALIEVTERLSVDNIAKAVARPDINFKAPVTDIVRGGFMPKMEKLGTDILKDTADEWAARTKELGGLTGGAFRLGHGLTEASDVEVLRDMSAKAKALYDAAKSVKDIDTMVSAATKQQFFNEALEAATGASPTKRAAIGQTLGADWKPPFPEVKEAQNGIVTTPGPDASGALPGNELATPSAPVGSIEGPFKLPPEVPRPDNTALMLPVEGVDSSVRYAGDDAGLTPLRFHAGKFLPGDEHTPPSPSYPDADRLARERGGNVWVRQSAEGSNKGRVLLVQFTPDLMYPNGPDPISTPYYDKLYSGARKGYARGTDFWELPQWVAVATKNLGSKADFYAVRNMAEAKAFMAKADYGRVAFSVMDVSKALTEELVPHIKGDVDLGGYTDRTGAAKLHPNAKIWDSMNDFVADTGATYAKGFDYRHFRGTEIIPRLELSAGCRHRCTFCTIDRKVTNAPLPEVNAQVDSFAGLNAKLVYLNDKTFGQSPNVAEMPRIYQEMKKANPDFEGFVVQTTAAQMKLFTDEFLQASGIKYVELGVETYNDGILKGLRKPATEKLIDEAVEKLRRNKINFIPNIVIGFPNETPATYARTMDFLNKHSDIVSHVNTYNLAVYEGTELAKTVKTKTAADMDENSPQKSFHADPKIHEDFAKQLYEYGNRQLEQPAAFRGEFMPDTTKMTEADAEAQTRTYMDIGHRAYNGIARANPDDRMWVWKDGKVKVAPATENANHEAKWGSSSWKTFKGRYDADKKLLSLAIPEKLADVTSPDQLPIDLLDQLYRQFGSDVSVSTFFSDGRVVTKSLNELNGASVFDPRKVAAGDFMPKTEAGRKLAEEGYDFVHQGGPLNRSVAVTKGGKLVGEIESVRDMEGAKDSANIADVFVASKAHAGEDHRGKGVGEALYRELLTDLKADDIKKVRGTIVGAGALAIRKNLFDKFSKLEVGGEPVSITRAFEALNRKPEGLYPVHVENEIPAKGQFMPKVRKESFDKFTDAEDTGFGNYWLSPEGKFIRVSNHREFAIEHLDPAPKTRDERVNSETVMKQLGWVRISRERGDGPDAVFINGDKLTQAQESALNVWAKNPSMTDVEVIDTNRIWKDAPNQTGQFMPKAKRKSIEEEVAKTDYSKYDVTSKATSSGTQDLTGWILPNQKYEKVEGGLHENHLAANSERFNKQFGTRFTPEPSEGERLAALNRGFVRVRAGMPVQGTVNVEVNARHFKNPTKKSIESFIGENAESIDRLWMSLLDDKGNVVDRIAKSVVDLEGKERAEALIESMNELRANTRGQMLPGEARVNIGRNVGDKVGALSEKEIIDALEAEGVKILKVTSLPAGQNEPTAVADLSRPLTPEEAARVSSKLKQEAIAQLTDAGGELYGPKADDWRPFKPEFFLDHGAQPGGKFLPGGEKDLPGLNLPSEDKAQQLRVKARIAKSQEKFPEALKLGYQKDEAGKFIIGEDGKPKGVTVEYGLMDTPLGREEAKGIRGEAERQTAVATGLSGKLYREAQAALKDPRLSAGAKWYSTARTRLKGLFGDDTKFMAELLGATSARTPVDINYRFALDAYNQFKQGKYDVMIKRYRAGKAKWDARNIDDFLAAHPDNQNPTRGQFLDWWVDKYDLSPVQSNGKKFGANSRQVLKVFDGTWAEEIGGPKTPNFAGNLAGTTFEATIDVWSARTLHRLANEGNPKPWRILPENETGVTDLDFNIGQEAYRLAAKELGMKPDSLQAVLWFAEKKHWEGRGWTWGAGSELSDFNTLLKDTERTPEGDIRRKKVQKELALDFGVNDIKKKKK